jgi:hypothetical protein
MQKILTEHSMKPVCVPDLLLNRLQYWEGVHYGLARTCRVWEMARSSV